MMCLLQPIKCCSEEQLQVLEVSMTTVLIKHMVKRKILRIEPAALKNSDDIFKEQLCFFV